MTGVSERAGAVFPVRRWSWRDLSADLAPFPGRLHHAVRIAVICALVAVLGMTLRIPETALAAYLVFMTVKPDAASSILTAAAFTVMAAVAVPLALVLLMVVADAPLLRFLAVAGLSFGGMWLTSATRIGAVTSILTLVLVMLITSIDNVAMPVPQLLELVIRGAIWLLVMIALPMIVIIVVHLIVGPSPAALVRRGVSARLGVIADRLAGGADVRPVLAAGDRATAGLAGKARLFVGARVADRLAARDAASLTLLQAVAALDRFPAAGRRDLSDLAAVAAALAEGRPPPPVPPARPDDDPAVRFVHDALADLVAAWDRDPPAPPPPSAREGLLRPDAFSNPDHVRFGFKVMMAALVCYMIYTGLDWPAIHTCMITCYIVALGSLAETMHKMTLRLTGATIGGVTALAVVLWLIPLMTDVGQLALLVAAVALPAAWIAVGSERLAYAGVQIALAFLLTILASAGPFGLNFAPTVDLTPAGGRVMGVLLGIVVTAGAFLTFWPTGTAKALGADLADLYRRLGDGATGPGPAADLYRRLAGLVDRAERLVFEPGRLRPDAGRQSTGWRLAAAVPDLQVALATLAAHRPPPDLGEGAARAVAEAEEQVRGRLGALADWIEGGPMPPACATIVPPNATSPAAAAFLAERAALHRRIESLMPWPAFH